MIMVFNVIFFAILQLDNEGCSYVGSIIILLIMTDCIFVADNTSSADKLVGKR